MCGRYYMDAEMEADLLRTIHQIDMRLQAEKVRSELRKRDVRPTDQAPVLFAKGQEIAFETKTWGYSLEQAVGERVAGNVIINAKSETITEKALFRRDILTHRAVIPASGFYEWNAQKEKNKFSSLDDQPLFMAGCFQKQEGGDRFVVITTSANESMAAVHDRMPLLLSADEIEAWLFEEEKARQLLRKRPKALKRETEYEQLSFF